MEKLRRPLSWPKCASQPLSHDLSMARKAARLTQDTTAYTDMPGLHMALALQRYMSQTGIQAPEASERRSAQLISAEKVGLELRQYIPTVGIEVEYPILLSSSSGEGALLSQIYDSIHDTSLMLGMRKNKDNAPTQDNSFYLELTTLPSYSAKVQAAMLAAFIRCEFIPHLEGVTREKISETIHRFLSMRGISLHINLKIPKWLDRIDSSYFDIDPDFATIMGAFAIVYSTPERLKYRYNADIFHIEDIEEPFQPAGDRRLEGIPFEVRDRQVYRLIEDLPYAFSAGFALVGDKHGASLDNKQKELATIGEDLVASIEGEYKKAGIDAGRLERRRDFYVECAKNPALRAALSKILSEHVRRVQMLLGT